MLPYRDSKLIRIVLIVFFLLVAAYAYYEFRGLLYGPSISISGRVMEVSEPLVTIEGDATRIARLSMNGQDIPVTEDGKFSEPYVLARGYNRIVLVASDKYGKSTERAIEIIYTPSPDRLVAPPASSTPASASSTLEVAPAE